MGIKTAANSFYQNVMVRTWHAITGSHKGKTVSKPPVDTSSLLGPHQEKTGIHREPPSRKVAVQPGVKPKIRRPPKVSESLSTETAKLNFKQPNGMTKSIEGVPLNAPIAALRVQIAEEIGIPAFRLITIKVDGKEVDDFQPVWSLMGSDEPTLVSVQAADTGKVPRHLERDINTLFEDSPLVKVFDDEEPTISQLNDYVYELCQDVMAGKMSPDAENYTDLQEYITTAMEELDTAELNDKNYALAYLMQLSNLLEAFEKYDPDAYKPPVPTQEPPVNFSLPAGQTIKVNGDKLKQALGRESGDEVKARVQPDPQRETVTVPVPKTVVTSEPTPVPGCNLGFTPLRRRNHQEKTETKATDFTLGLKELSGKAYNLPKVKPEASIAEVKLRMVTENGMPLSQVFSLNGQGHHADEQQRVGDYLNPGQAPQLILVKMPLDPIALEKDMQTLMPEQGSNYLVPENTVVSQLNQMVTDCCRPFITGEKLEHPDQEFREIQQEIESARERIAETDDLVNARYAQAYLDQLSGIMQTFAARLTPVELPTEPPSMVIEPFTVAQEVPEPEKTLLTEVITPARQRRLNEELTDIFDLEWNDLSWKDINWKKAADLVKAGADPSISLRVENCPNPLFLAAANYTSDRALLKNGDPNEADRLMCLGEMLKHPKAAQAMSETDDDDFGNTPLTWALAVGDQAAANMMVDYIDQAMTRGGGEVAQLLTQPNEKQGAHLVQNTPLMLALKTGCDESAKKLMHAYNEDDLTQYKSASGHDALDMICYKRLDGLMPLVTLYGPEERKAEFSKLYLSSDRVPSLEEDVYSKDMYLGKRTDGSAALAYRPEVDEDRREALKDWQPVDDQS